MKQIILIITLIGLIFLTGCQSQTQTKYQCANGEVVDSLALCSFQTCPKLNCSEFPKQIETETKEVIKYQCQDGTVKDRLADCDIIQVAETPNILNTDVKYKFDNYLEYQLYITPELERLTGVQGIRKYGSTNDEKRGDSSVYFLMSKGDSWGESYRFWAVEVNAETGELLKYKEISNDGCPGSPGICPNSDELWW
ncbi:MAG: hypothetical protein WC852_06015 [Candidatus Nanoarchaeia archaeon]|jgi:hypothetical protein